MASRQTFAEIHQAMTSLARAIDRSHEAGLVRRCSGIELDRALHPVVFTVGAHQPVSVSEIADRLALRRPTISRHVTRLAQLGLITREGNEADGRSHFVALSVEGQRVLDQLMEGWYTIIDDSLNSWPADEIRTLRTLLARFAAALHEQSRVRGAR